MSAGQTAYVNEGKARGLTGRIVEASEDHVVFAPAWRVPPTVRAAAGALALALLPPTMYLEWVHFVRLAPVIVFGLVIPLALWIAALVSIVDVALAWSPVPPLRGPFRVERRPSAGSSVASPSFVVRSGKGALGPSSRRALFQLRLYEEQPLDLGE